MIYKTHLNRTCTLIDNSYRNLDRLNYHSLCEILDIIVLASLKNGLLTFAPPCRSFSHIAFPIPDAPPVTIATAPSIFMIVLLQRMRSKIHLSESKMTMVLINLRTPRPLRLICMF